MGRGGRLAPLAEFAYRRRRLTVVSWVGALVAVIALAPALAGEFSADFAVPGSDSRAARDITLQRFGGSTETVDVVWRSEAGAEAPAVRREIEPLPR